MQHNSKHETYFENLLHSRAKEVKELVKKQKAYLYRSTRDWRWQSWASFLLAWNITSHESHFII